MAWPGLFGRGGRAGCGQRAATRRIRTIKVGGGTTLPDVYVDRRDREVPIRSAKSWFDIPDLATRAGTSDATSARSESAARF